MVCDLVHCLPSQLRAFVAGIVFILRIDRIQLRHIGDDPSHMTKQMRQLDLEKGSSLVLSLSLSLLSSINADNQRVELIEAIVDMCPDFHSIQRVRKKIIRSCTIVLILQAKHFFPYVCHCHTLHKRFY